MAKKKEYQRAVMVNYVSEALGEVRAGKIPEYIEEDLTKEDIYSLARQLGIRPSNKFQEEMLTVAVFCDLYSALWKEDQARRASQDPPMSGAQKRIQLDRTKKAANRFKEHLEYLHRDFIDETMWLRPEPDAPRQKPTDEIYTIIDVTSDISDKVTIYSEYLDQIEISEVPRVSGNRPTALGFDE